MNTQEQIKRNIQENAQRGAFYEVVFENDPNTYVGIPVALPGVTPECKDRFEFKIIQPAHRRGIAHARYEDVIRLQRRE